MPKINIEHKSTLAPSDALAKIKIFFETDEGLKKFDANMKCQFDDKTLKGKVTGKQFKADVSVASQGVGSAGSQVQVVIDLPLLLSPFKGKVQETIERKLSKYLA